MTAPGSECCARCDQKTAIAFIDHTLSKLPFQVERVQTDNGAEFGTSFHWHLLDKGIDHVKIKPHTPRLNGKVCEDLARRCIGVGLTQAKV